MTVPTLHAVIKGTGSALPRNRVSNAELAAKVDTTDEWITERTGIKFRHIAEPDETTSSLAIEASRNALEAANMAASDIDVIILAAMAAWLLMSLRYVRGSCTHFPWRKA